PFFKSDKYSTGRKRVQLGVHLPSRGANSPPWTNDRTSYVSTRRRATASTRKTQRSLHDPRAKAGASSTHSTRCRAVAERLGLREAFGVRPACRRFPQFMVPMHAQERKDALPVGKFPR